MEALYLDLEDLKQSNSTMGGGGGGKERVLGTPFIKSLMGTSVPPWS